ncbi:MAPEG family protein [Motiliproteus sp. SC1-56]|uniref:MAPEG family protein n=1 Tax=Motiliproteus sp. SC1-56 TaxID=2799565 RepID=UPI001A90BD1C|nr:MAPEG family protein [Motiliproteus sp. SC1-56]
MPLVLVTLFIVSLLPILLAGLSHYFRAQMFGRVDNAQPRAQQAQLTGAGARVVAAQQNAWESLVVYTVAIFIAHAAGVDLHELTVPALLFVGFRLLHALFYVLDRSTLRSLAFSGGMGCCVYIFVVAVQAA